MCPTWKQLQEIRLNSEGKISICIESEQLSILNYQMNDHN